MENKICKIVLQYIAPNAIFAVLFLLMSSCSAKQKLVEHGSSLSAETKDEDTRSGVWRQELGTDSATVFDSIQTQISASVEVHQEDSVTTVRVTDYDTATGMPIRTTETEHRRVTTDTKANSDYLQSMISYAEYVQTMQQMYDSLVLIMTHQTNIAQRDSTYLRQESVPSFSQANLKSLVITVLIFAVFCFAIKLYFRR